MKGRLVTLTALGALSLGSLILAHGQDSEAHDRRAARSGGRNPLERMTADLNLTPEQKAKIQPIIDQAGPQIQAIHREAMQKLRAVMDNAKSQIRPLLTPDQQKQLDSAQSDRRDRFEGRKRQHQHNDADSENDESED